MNPGVFPLLRLSLLGDFSPLKLFLCPLILGVRCLVLDFRLQIYKSIIQHPLSNTYFSARGGSRTHMRFLSKDFKSFVYTIPPLGLKIVNTWRLGWELHPCARFCRPFSGYLSTEP